MDNQSNETQNQTSSGLFSGGAPAPAAETAPAAPPAADLAPDAPKFDEREALMSRARLMGIDFSNNIGTDTLRKRINDKLDGVVETPPAPPVAETAALATAPSVSATNALTGEPASAPEKSLRQQLLDDAMALKRLRITCMDPKKKDLKGEIFTVANEYIGTVTKFVPFGEATDNGFHVPHCIYEMLRDREFLNVYTTKDARTKVEVVHSRYAREFALEVMEPLTQTELNRLATAQAAAGSVD